MWQDVSAARTDRAGCTVTLCAMRSTLRAGAQLVSAGMASDMTTVLT